jgi:hypothetical protein
LRNPTVVRAAEFEERPLRGANLEFEVRPFAGLPIPASVKRVADGRPIHVVFLADALLFVAAYVWLRRRSPASEA